MPLVKTTKYNYKKAYKLAERNVPFLDATEEKTIFDGKYVYIFEDINSRPISLTYDFEEDKVVLRDKTTEMAEEALEVYRVELRQKFGVLKSLIPTQSFTLYGNFNKYENFKSDFTFYDLYMNENWFCPDDFFELMDTCNLKTPIILFEGIFSKLVLKDLLQKGFNRLTIRNELESTLNSKRPIAYVSKQSFIKKTKEEITKSLSTEVLKMLSKFITVNRIQGWRSYVKNCHIPLETNRLSSILPLLVRKSLIDLTVDTMLLAENKGFEEKEIEKEVKRVLPNIIRKSLNI